jgi:anti-sigma regulatory factor (Ser/Thr protein kinase)
VTAVATTTVIPAGIDSAARARAWLEPLVPMMTDLRMQDLRLAVSELVTNAVLHAGLACGDPIRLSRSVSADRVVVTVTDGGRGFALRRPDWPGPDEASGRGLLIVAEVCKRLLVEPARGRVTVEVGRR